MLLENRPVIEFRNSQKIKPVGAGDLHSSCPPSLVYMALIIGILLYGYSACPQNSPPSGVLTNI